jgi:hypothetical protein
MKVALKLAFPTKVVPLSNQGVRSLLVSHAGLVLACWVKAPVKLVFQLVTAVKFVYLQVLGADHYHLFPAA